MDAAGYVALGRQSGLMREMQTVANNIANVSTTGFRREGVVFSEFIDRLDRELSISMGFATGKLVDLSQGGIQGTGGAFDFAIQGDGFFQIETPAGNRLTRAGSFTPNPNGELVTDEGFRLLDAGGAPVFVPPGAKIAVGADGTLSADGTAIGQIGLWQPVDPLKLSYAGGTMFDGGEVQPAEGATLMQGYLEDSNVNPVSEIARMIEVQRAYEMGQKFLDAEDARARSVIQTLGR